MELHSNVQSTTEYIRIGVNIRAAGMNLIFGIHGFVRWHWRE